MRNLILTLALLLSVTMLFSQPPREGEPMRHSKGASESFRPPHGERGRDRSSLLELSLQLMRERMKLDEQQGEAFEALYTQYHGEVSKLTRKPIEITDSATEQELEKKIYESFDITDATTAVKREYYPKFREIISTSQILKMYGIERELLMRISLEGERRKRSRQKR